MSEQTVFYILVGIIWALGIPLCIGLGWICYQLTKYWSKW